MAECIIALGSNLNNRLHYLKIAKIFLERLSETPLQVSSLYESEPIGGISTFPFLNAAIRISSSLSPEALLAELKSFEKDSGRDPAAPRWSNRVIDLDIISYNQEIYMSEDVQIPHPEYPNRLFVLLPMADIVPDWQDPSTEKTLSEIISSAPKISVSKTNLNW